ncbi:peroxidase family protein [Luteolibacter pohnpeiensis]|nr:heme peroxidase family protein [Luteolibacter pohnpeiensis]
MNGCPIKHHGVTKAIGCKHIAVSNFSKLFPNLPGLEISEEEAAIIGGPGGLMHDYNDASKDSSIPSGYTFFAQFVDHDITLDTTTALHGGPIGNVEVAKLPNLRSPSLDLDCVYGFGPDGSPHLYDGSSPGRLAIHPNGHDLARSPSGTALIGDPRNDENIFVSQMQLLMQKFHNKILDRRVHSFDQAQEETRYHYQWIILYDFLKRLCDPKIYKWALARIHHAANEPYPILFSKADGKPLTMPVEFSVAAYRVGHTLVRSHYSINSNNRRVELFDERFGTLGFSALPEELVVDWSLLLPVSDSTVPVMTKAIDELLTDELHNLPLPVVNSQNPNDRSLAFRNLLRGSVMGLPSGQAVAGALNQAGYPIEPNIDLRLDQVNGWKKLKSLRAKNDLSLINHTPLFYYLLRESEIVHQGQKYGPTGSALLMEVFGGMLLHCETSFLKVPDWQPDPWISQQRSCPMHSHSEGSPFDRAALEGDQNYYPFELADIVRFVENAD